MADAHEQLRMDDVMAPLIDEYGELTVEPASDLFERLVVAIVRQQLSMAAADTIRARLFDRYEVSPGHLKTVPAEELAETGLSNRKAETIRRAGETFHERGYSREYFAAHSTDAVIDELTEITGIGPWTAKMVCLFGLGHEDVFPVEDLGIRKGMQTVFEEELTRAKMIDRAQPWRPYRSIASLYLWRVSDGDKPVIGEQV
ncbi:MAG: DNA-3-methyladenine glycosylase family protein [archaeon]